MWELRAGAMSLLLRCGDQAHWGGVQLAVTAPCLVQGQGAAAEQDDGSDQLLAGRGAEAQPCRGPGAFPGLQVQRILGRSLGIRLMAPMSLLSA